MDIPDIAGKSSMVNPEGQAKGWHTGVYGTYGYGMAHQIQKKVNFRTGSGN